MHCPKASPFESQLFKATQHLQLLFLDPSFSLIAARQLFLLSCLCTTFPHDICVDRILYARYTNTTRDEACRV